MQPYRSYFICTAPRSGSTLLCKLLAATGAAGRPGSHFHEPSFEAWLDAYDLEADRFATRQDARRAIFDAAIAYGRDGTDIFGLRIQGKSFGFFLNQLSELVPDEASDVARIEAVFGPTLFIHLTRPDRLGQAISRLRAETSGLWHKWADGSELERLEPRQPPGYDRDKIAQHMREAENYDAAWERWFDAQGLTPLRLTYDRLADNPQAALATILDALALDPALSKVETPTAKLADEENARWRARFEAGD